MIKENYATFFARVEPWMAPSDILKLKLAYQLAKAAHRGQERKEVDSVSGQNIRYYEHPRRVALYLLDRCKVKDVNIIIAALMHDVLEDTRMTAEMLEYVFDKEIAQNVKLLSKFSASKEGYYERLYNLGNTKTWVVKMADRIDNLSHMETCSVEFIKKQVLETETNNKLFNTTGCPHDDVSTVELDRAVKCVSFDLEIALKKAGELCQCK